VTAYEKSHPGVTVKTVALSYDSYESTMDTEIAAHSGPDIMIWDDSLSEPLIVAGDLSPITSLTPAEVKSLIPNNSVGVSNGKRFSLVWEANDDALMYNKKLFAEAGIKAPPTNFQSFLSDCLAIKQKTGDYGYSARNMLDEEESWYGDFTQNWITGWGGSWMNKAGQFVVNQPDNIQALTAYNKVYHSGCMETGEDASVFRAQFEAGKIGMLTDNEDGAYTYTAGNRILTNQVMGGGIEPFPTHLGASGMEVITINKYAPNQALAQNFIQWLFEPANQARLQIGTEPLPVGTDIAAPTAFINSHQWAKAFLQVMGKSPDVLMEGRPTVSPKFALVLMPYLERVLQGQLTPKQALDQVQAAAVQQFGN